jgi:hypothetical protein
LVFVRAREDDSGHAENILVRNLGGVGWVRIEFKRVDTDGDRSYQTVIKLLVQFEVVGRSDKDEFPFDIWCWIWFPYTKYDETWSTSVMYIRNDKDFKFGKKGRNKRVSSML